MNIVLWIVQAILAIKLVSVAFTHAFQRLLPTMQEAIEKMGKVSPTDPHPGGAYHVRGIAGIDPPGGFGILPAHHPGHGWHPVSPAAGFAFPARAQPGKAKGLCECGPFRPDCLRGVGALGDHPIILIESIHE